MNKHCKLCDGTYDFRKLMISNGEIALVGHLSMCNIKNKFRYCPACGEKLTKENRSMSNLLCTLVDNYVQLNKQQERLTAYYNLISSANKSDTE